MSHFVVLALLAPEQAQSREQAEKSLETLLEPYNEAIEVDEYEKPCYCINMTASSDARKRVKEERGLDIGTIREAYWKLPEEERTDAKWQEAIKPLAEAEEEFQKEHPEYQKPDAKCDDCKGSGMRKTTYNPKSKWDWWTIGGRWSGMLVPDYDPSTDPANIETCTLCTGTGTRPDGVLLFGKEWAEACNGCNGCNGTGKTVKWPTSWRDFEGDILPLSQVKDDTIPYAILTPDGRWLERGKMGWFGMSTDEKDPEVWAETVKNVRAEFADCMAVVVDCHI